MLSKENWMATVLRPHIGHNIACVYYGDADDPADICIECEDCGGVLVSSEDFNDEPVCCADCVNAKAVDIVGYAGLWCEHWNQKTPDENFCGFGKLREEKSDET